MLWISGSEAGNITAYPRPLPGPSNPLHTPHEMNSFWRHCLSHFEKELPVQQFVTWIKPLKYHAQGDVVTIWAVPIFHANGWCYVWPMTGIGACNVLLRRPTGKGVLQAIADHDGTHVLGAPIIAQLMAEVPQAERPAFAHPVRMLTAGAPPTPAHFVAMEELGVQLDQGYGLTEVWGPAIFRTPDSAWSKLSPLETRALKTRRGFRTSCSTTSPSSIPPPASSCRTMGRRSRGSVSGQCGDARVPEGSTGDGERLRWRYFIPAISQSCIPTARWNSGPIKGHHHLRRENFRRSRSRTSSASTRVS